MKPRPFSRSMAGVSSQTPQLAVGGGDAAARVHRVHDALGHHVAGRQLVHEALAAGVVQGRAVAPGGLGQGVAGERLGPHRAGGVASARSRARGPRRPARAPAAAPRAWRRGGWCCPGRARRPRRAGRRRRPAPRRSACTRRRAPLPPGRHRGEPAVAVGGQARRGGWPPTPRRRSRARRRAGQRTISAPVRSPACSRRLRVAPPQRSRRSRPVVAAEGHAERLEPLDRVGAALGEPAHELGPRGVMPRREGVLEVRLGGVVVAQGRLDAALGAPGVPGPEGRLGRHQHRGSGLTGAERRRHPGAAGTHHEHVGARLCRFRHPRTLANSRRCFQ